MNKSLKNIILISLVIVTFIIPITSKHTYKHNTFQQKNTFCLSPTSQISFVANEAKINILDKQFTNKKQSLRETIEEINQIFLLKLKHILLNFFGEQAYPQLKTIKNKRLKKILKDIFFNNPMNKKEDNFFLLKKKKSAYFYFDFQEKRMFISLHRKKVAADGPYITVAFTPPTYSQQLHKHELTDEYNFLIDPINVILQKKEGKKVFKGVKADLFHISNTAFHTLDNTENSFSRNLSVKEFLDKRILTDTKVNPLSKNNHDIEKIKPKLGLFTWGQKKTYHITTLNNFTYEIELIDIKPKQQTTIKAHPNKKPNSEEIVIQFSDTIIIADNEQKKHAISKEDVLYIGKTNHYTLTNISNAPATLYRLTILNEQNPKEITIPAQEKINYTNNKTLSAA